MCPCCGEPEIDAYGTCLHCGYGITEKDRMIWSEEQGKACEMEKPEEQCRWPDCECKDR